MAGAAPRAVRSFVSALLPADAGGPDPDVVAAATTDYLSHLPAEHRAVVRGGFALLGTALPLVSRGGEPADALRRLARLGPTAALAVDGLKAVVLLAGGATAHAAEIAATANARTPVRPDPELRLVPATQFPAATKVDAVVVGSGAGGAVAARRLARDGLDVLVVEEGRHWGVEDIRSTSALHRYARMYRDGGATVMLGNPPVTMPIGRAVGGTTVVNSGTCYRPPAEVQHRWAAGGFDLADPDRLAGHLDEVEQVLGVAPASLEVLGRNGRTVLAGAEALGWAAGPLHRNATGCRGACQCALGCPDNAKSAVHLSVLPDACAHGARIVTDARVERIVHDGHRADGIVARRPDGTRFEVRAEMVVLAAGALGSPELLGRSGMGAHPMVGCNLAVHPALGVAGRFAEAITPWQGILQSAGVEELHRSRRILIEATSTPPGMGSLVLPGYGAELVDNIARADHLATVGAMIGDRGSGRVRRVGRRSVLTYRLHGDDAARLLESIDAMGRLLMAAGAASVLTGLANAPEVRTSDELADAVAGADVRALHLAAFHPTGTLAAGGDPQRHPVDGRGRLRGWEGIVVADASVLPSCPEVNPQVSIMAVADAIASSTDTSTAPRTVFCSSAAGQGQRRG